MLRKACIGVKGEFVPVRVVNLHNVYRVLPVSKAAGAWC
jgi:hypothetical protein